jgi:hypothetical protein
MVLKFKVNELQKICNTLANTNCQLSEKLTLLTEEKESNKRDETYFDEYSVVNGDFTEIESLISEYKQSLDCFQSSVLEDMKLKEEKTSKLKAQLKSLSDENGSLKAENDALQSEKETVMKINK